MATNWTSPIRYLEEQIRRLYAFLNNTAAQLHCLLLFSGSPKEPTIGFVETFVSVLRN